MEAENDHAGSAGSGTAADGSFVVAAGVSWFAVWPNTWLTARSNRATACTAGWAGLGVFRLRGWVSMAGQAFGFGLLPPDFLSPVLRTRCAHRMGERAGVRVRFMQSVEMTVIK